MLREITSKGNLGSSSRSCKWKPENCQELINKSNINAYWNTKDWSQSTSIFGAVSWCYIWYSIFLREGDTGKLKNVQNLVQHFSEQFRNYYVPPKNVSIDESLIGYEGKGPAIQSPISINTLPLWLQIRKNGLFCMGWQDKKTCNFDIYRGIIKNDYQYQ